MVVGKWLPFPLFHSALFELLILLDWNSPSPKKSLPKKFHAGSCFRSLHAVGRGQTLRKHQLFGGYRCSILVWVPVVSLFRGGCSFTGFSGRILPKAPLNSWDLTLFWVGFGGFFDPDLFGILPKPPANLGEDDEATNPLHFKRWYGWGTKKTQTTWQFLVTFLECFSDPNSNVHGLKITWSDRWPSRRKIGGQGAEKGRNKHHWLSVI